MNAPDCLCLQGALTIVGAQAQRERLMALLDGSSSDVVLDASGVDAVDSAGVQLLLALRRSLGNRSATLSLVRPAPVVSAVLATYGLQYLLAPAVAVPPAPKETP